VYVSSFNDNDDDDDYGDCGDYHDDDGNHDGSDKLGDM
jgi:hypothetical protein